MSQVIKFLHPGAEARPESHSDKLEWNNGATRTRKFMKQSGDFIDAEDTLQPNIPLALWGEWEAQAKVLFRLESAIPNKPSFIYEPYYARDYNGARKHNTDPYIFGKSMRYVNFLQTKSGGKARTQLSRLEPGDVILFGSTIAKKFALDTVFVVGSYTTYTQQAFKSLYEHEQIVSDPIFKMTALTPIQPANSSKPVDPTSNPLSEVEQRLYFGVTYDQRDQFNGMYSFPCQPFQQNRPYESAFARPFIQLDELNTEDQAPKAGQLKGVKLLSSENNPNLAQEIWQQILTQIQQQGLFAGVRFSTPSVK